MQIEQEEHIPDVLALAEAVTQQEDWKEALDSVLAVVRSIFLFDNLALYLLNENPANLTEIVYARAVGRGQSAGADAAWGVETANQVIRQNQFILANPTEAGLAANRLREPYLLGLPLRNDSGIAGALVFVRFGGPPYTPEQVQRAQYIATQVASLLERKTLKEKLAALEDARRLLALQDDFIATISHELRTPLGFIKGYATTLLRQDAEWDEQTRREFLTIIAEEADHLNELIENVLESARLQSNTLPIHLQPLRLDALLKDILSRGKARYKETDLHLELSLTPLVLADGVRLTQVFENLLSNAAKYAPGAPVHLRLTPKENACLITFADSGPGIAPQHLPHIFQRFYRVPGQGGSGSGLGLFICKKIIEAHGGTIWVESEPGQGTSFLIQLPIFHAP